MMVGSCFRASPPPAVTAALFSVLPPQQQPAAVVACSRLRQPVVARRAHCFLPPRPRLIAAIQAHNHVGVGDGGDPHPHHHDYSIPFFLLETHNYFPKEGSHVASYLNKLHNVYDGLLHYESGNNTLTFLLFAETAVTMASHVVDSASLNPSTTSGEISRETVHRTLDSYVQIFVQSADDTFNNTVNKETVTSFLGALGGMGSVAHILLETALEGLSHEHPKESLSEYAFNYDVKKMHRVYDRRMRELEDGIRNTKSTMRTCKILMPTICEGMEATVSFIGLMLARRKRTLGKTHRKVAK